MRGVSGWWLAYWLLCAYGLTQLARVVTFVGLRI